MQTLKIGSSGKAVEQLQAALGASLGRRIVVDGQYGPRTTAAVSDFQYSRGLPRTGIADTATLSALGLIQEKIVEGPKHSFKPGPATKLTPFDFVEVAGQLQVPVAALRAFAEVEAGGSGFLANGLPKILFERHIFWRQLGSEGLLDQRAAFHKQCPDICGPTAYTNKRDAAPGDRYINGEGNYERLEAAMAISRTAALNSCSWGMFQVMGFNAVPIGYSSTQEFVDRMFESEMRHLESVARFILKDRQLVTALRALDWRTVAARYNGPAFEKFNYHTKMATAYEKWSKVA